VNGGEDRGCAYIMRGNEFWDNLDDDESHSLTYERLKAAVVKHEIGLNSTVAQVVSMMQFHFTSHRG
jgi:hypothetical protein